MKREIPWWTVNISTIDKSIFNRALKNNFPNEGEITLELSELTKSFLRVKHAIFTTSGTTALFLALKSIGIGPGSRVAVPNLTFIATANAVHLTGAEVVLIDIRSDSFTISKEELERLHAEKPFDAVIPVHVSGRSAFQDNLIEWAKINRVTVIEDAAEAFGSKDPERDSYLGTLGAAGAFSFSPNKLITSGQGGLVVTNDDELAREIVKLKDQGRPKRGTGGDDIHECVGYNFKFTDIQACLLLAQFPLIQKRLDHLSFLYRMYSSELQDTENYVLGYFDVNKGEIPLWPEILSSRRRAIEQKLEENQIGFRRVWYPLSTQIPYANSKPYPNSFKVSREAMWLLSSFNLSTRDVKRVIKNITDIFD